MLSSVRGLRVLLDSDVSSWWKLPRRIVTFRQNFKEVDSPGWPPQLVLADYELVDIDVAIAMVVHESEYLSCRRDL